MALALAAGFAHATVPSEGRVPDSYIVQVAPGVDPDVAASDIEAATGAGIGHVYRHALNGFSARIPAGRLAALERHPLVVSVVADRYVAIDGPPGGCSPWPECKGGGTEPEPPPPEQSNQTVPTGIARIGGPVAGPVEVDVAVIDSGVSSHPDLNLAGGYNCTRGRTDKYADGNGHGTHVAGTIGAKDNGIGVVGVAPGARIWAVRVLNSAGSGTWGDVICGIDWVAANAGTIEVANMSLGGGGSDTGCSDGGMNQAICAAVNAGVTFVVAAGNESDDAAKHVPAAYDEVITVSALADFNGVAGGGADPTCRPDVDDTFANFSNYGADVDIIAPGVCIESTWNDGTYNTISGTSMASPHVAGAAALYKAHNAGATPAQVKSALQAAGNLDWSDLDDPDGTQEKLLNLGGL